MVSLTNSNDIIANSVSIVQDNEIINILDLISQITGLAPATLNTLQELASSINNDNTFYNTINTQLATKANSADVYIRSETYTQSQINTALSGKQASITPSSSLSLGSITTTGSTTADKIISRYFEPPTGSTDLNFNISSANIMTITNLLIKLMKPVYIDQGCKIDHALGLSIGTYTSPTLWAESIGIQGGNITTSNNINAGVDIYATDGKVKSKTLEVTTTSTFTGTVTANEIKPSTITHNDVSATGKLIIKAGDTLEFQNSDNFPLFNVSSLPNRGFRLGCHLLMNNFSITGGMDIACARHLVAGSNVVATDELQGRTLKITTTSVFDGNITAPNIYTKDEVNGLLSNKASTTALSGKQDTIAITTTLSLQQLNAMGSVFCAKLVSSAMETSSTTIRFRVSTNTEVASLTAALISLKSPVLIEQGCKIQNELSVGSYSLITPSLWVETASFLNGNFYSSNNITAGSNVVATDELKGRTLKITTTSVFDGNITAPNIYTKDEVNGLLSGYATASSVSGLQQQISSTSALSLASITLTGSLTCTKVIAPVLESNNATLSLKVNTNTEVLSLTDTGSFFNNTIKTNRADETLLFLATKYKFYDKFLTETFGHDGTNNYMLHHLDMRGKSIHNATNLSALSYVYTPTVRTRNIEFWDVDTSGGTDLKIISGANTFMAFSTISTNVKINVFKPILSVEDIQAGSLTTISGNISSTTGNFQTRDGTVGGARGSFNQLYVSGVKDVTAPSSRGIYLGLDSDAAGGIDICADTNQYIDFTTLNNNYRGRLIYNNTNNDFKMHVNGSTTPSLTLNSTSLSTNVITCSHIVTTGTARPIIPTTTGAYLGCDGGGNFCALELTSNAFTGASATGCYIDFATPNIDYNGRLMFFHGEMAFSWFIGTGGARLRLSASTLTGPAYSATSDKRLKFNEKPLTNALDVINKLEPLEYDQTQDIVDEFNENTPHIHQCGFIAQSIQEVDELKHAVMGGEIGEDGKETIRSLNYNAIFTYAVKSIQELHTIVKQQQEQIDAQKQQIERLINVILNA